MDLCSSLREGEQFWFQIVVIPTGFDWMAKTEKIVDKILNKKKKTSGFIMKMVEWFGDLGEILFSIWGDIEDKEEKDSSLSMMELTPKQKKQIEAVQMKASKLAFEAKIRVVYASRKDVINRGKVVNGFIGYMKQFIALDLNNLMPDVKLTMTKAVYFNKSKRLVRKKNRLMRNYVNRDDFAGRSRGIFNIEELATLWHFPIEANVKAPMIQKAPGRKADAPSSLPVTEDFAQQAPELFQSDILQRKPEVIVADNEDNLEKNFESSAPDEAIPENLPFV